MADSTLTVVVVETGATLTHELTLACRGHRVAVLGPVRTPEDVRSSVAAADRVVIVTEPTPSAFLRELVGSLPGVRVLAMTDPGDPSLSAEVIAAGAAGVLERGADRRVLVDGLRRAFAGELVLPAAHLSAVLDLVDSTRAIDANRDRMRTLTRREREILSLLAQGRTTNDIARSLSISALTVQSHVKNLLAKLGVHSKVEAIRYAWRSGVLEIPVGA
jgi:DNA-binding NarL/FixJ family response regulator